MPNAARNSGRRDASSLKSRIVWAGALKGKVRDGLALRSGAINRLLNKPAAETPINPIPETHQTWSGVVNTNNSPPATDPITIANTVNYDGSYPVLASSTADQVNITVAYNAETFDGVNDSHNLTFDGVDDLIGLTAAQSIPADTTRKELHIANHDATYYVYFGDSNVNAATYRGLPVAPESVYILTCTDEIFLACEAGAGVAGCRVSWGNFTKT